MNIIFHHPLPLDENAKSGSGIRPLRMLNAFRDLGCNVDLVVGYAEERKKSILQIKRNVDAGKKYDFVYSESSTMPTILTETHHLPLHPFLDWHFFRFCKSLNIPVGLFYRDVYWLFDSYGQELNPVKVAVAKFAYRFDLWVYQRTLTKLYLPSLEMGAYVPSVNPSIFTELPPGHTSSEIVNQNSFELPCRPLKLFYVGGMSNHYKMHKLFDAVRTLPSIQLTVCTRESEWKTVKDGYPDLSTNINVVHLSGIEMEAYLKSCDIAVLFVEPQEYWEFASPVKLYEYLGFQKPIIASEGTLAGRFVKEKGIGWTLPYEVGSVSDLLKELIENPALFYPVCEKLRQVVPEHSWQARAEQVIKDLS